MDKLSELIEAIDALGERFGGGGDLEITVRIEPGFARGDEGPGLAKAAESAHPCHDCWKAGRRCRYDWPGGWECV